MGCDGSGQTNLTNNSASDREPSWASGGKLAFSSNRGSDDDYDIYLLTLSPWGIERLTTNEANDTSPALSPDGSKVAYVSYRNGNADPEIYVLKVSDKSDENAVQITDNTAKDLDPAWSPDGTKIAFASDRDGNFDIFKANASDGSGVEKVADVSHSTGNDRWPDFVDYFGDEMIAFASDRDDDWEVFFYDPVFDDLVQITLNIQDRTDTKPSWSMSGEEMVFHTNRDGNLEVVRALYDGKEYTNITRVGYSISGDSDESSPDWEPVENAGYCGE